MVVSTTIHWQPSKMSKTRSQKRTEFSDEDGFLRLKQLIPIMDGSALELSLVANGANNRVLAVAKRDTPSERYLATEVNKAKTLPEVQEKIRLLISEGRSPEQATAIAWDMHREGKLSTKAVLDAVEDDGHMSDDASTEEKGWHEYGKKKKPREEEDVAEKGATTEDSFVPSEVDDPVGAGTELTIPIPVDNPSWSMSFRGKVKNFMSSLFSGFESEAKENMIPFEELSQVEEIYKSFDNGSSLLWEVTLNVLASDNYSPESRSVFVSKACDAFKDDLLSKVDFSGLSSGAAIAMSKAVSKAREFGGPDTVINVLKNSVEEDAMNKDELTAAISEAVKSQMEPIQNELAAVKEELSAVKKAYGLPDNALSDQFGHLMGTADGADPESKISGATAAQAVKTDFVSKTDLEAAMSRLEGIVLGSSSREPEITNKTHNELTLAALEGGPFNFQG